MRIHGVVMAGMLALSAPAVAHAIPLANTAPAGTFPATGIIQVWGGCGWGWHPVAGHWSRWRGGWVPPHCAPNRYYSRGPYGGWRGPYY
jgi:hypothetical protein